MERRLFNDLLEWKKGIDRKPLILRGARQVGKTWLMKEFGRRVYRNCAYINFEGNERMARLFSADLDVSRILTGLRVETACSIDPSDTLLIFDEVQEVPKALGSLKYFQENAPQYHIIAGGSLLGIALHQGTSFPVGKVAFLDLHPLTFSEFLEALGKQNLLELLYRGDWKLVHQFKESYIDLLRSYFCVGGMPEAVASFVDRRDFLEARIILERLLQAYEQDFSKHAPPAAVPRIRQIWNSMPAQLARENRKFVYGLIREGARAREYETGLQWLCDCGLASKLFRVTKPGLPLKAYEDPGVFKLFMHDVGLLAAQSGLPVQAVLDGNRLFEEFKGALTEQFVFQQLASRKDLSLYYWSSGTATAEIDFLIQDGTHIFPLEVKAGENLQAKSLKVFRDSYAPERCFRTSLSSFREEGWLTNIPLYAVEFLMRPYEP
jgi:hypothetical protein